MPICRFAGTHRQTWRTHGCPWSPLWSVQISSYDSSLLRFDISVHWHWNTPVNQSLYQACSHVYARLLCLHFSISLSLLHMHTQHKRARAHTHAHNSCYTVLSNESLRNVRGQSDPPTSTSVRELHAISPPRSSSSSASLAQAELLGNGTWQRQGRSVQLKTQKKHNGAKLATLMVDNVQAVTVYLPHIRPFQPQQRFAGCNSSSGRKTVFRLLATSRPPSSGLHLWLVDIQLLPRQIPYLHASLPLVRVCACLCPHWRIIYLITFGIGHIPRGRHCIV